MVLNIVGHAYCNDQLMLAVKNFFSYEQGLYLWLIAGLILLTTEIIAPAFFVFVSFGIGCFAAALASFLNFCFNVQFFFMLSGIATSLIACTFYAKKKKNKSFLTNYEALIGQTCLVVTFITHEKSGRIKIRGEEWPALSAVKEETHEPLTLVRIVSVQGNKVLVHRIT